jgi:hypothetical protein
VPHTTGQYDLNLGLTQHFLAIVSNRELEHHQGFWGSHQIRGRSTDKTSAFMEVFTLYGGTSEQRFGLLLEEPCSMHEEMITVYTTVVGMPEWKI